MDLKNITENAVPKHKRKENMKESLRQNIRTKVGKLCCLEEEAKGNEKEVIFENIMDKNQPDLFKFWTRLKFKNLINPNRLKEGRERGREGRRKVDPQIIDLQ